MTSEEDFDYCVEAYMNVYTILKLCVDVEGQGRMYNVLGSLVFRMAIGKQPIAYREPRGALPPMNLPICEGGGGGMPPPSSPHYDAQLEDIHTICKTVCRVGSCD